MSTHEEENDTSGSSDELNEPRPNRWNGPKSTWRKLTKQETELAASLDHIRNADLSIHLYSAHALKRRAREYIENPEKSKEENPAIPEEDLTFNPPKYWTAWPLPPEDVPRKDETVGPDDPFAAYTFKLRETDAPSREIEDVLTGLALRQAKERFQSRETEGDNLLPTRSRSRKGETRSRQTSNESMSGDSSSDGDSESEHESVILQPVVAADDEHARDVLRPSIRHTLSKLDEVLMALHHVRQTCRTVSFSEGTTDEETSGSGSESITPERRPRGRPRKFANLAHRTRNGDVAAELEDSTMLRSKKTHLGRPQKIYERLDGESQQDCLVRIARMQKKALPVFAPPLEMEAPKSPARRSRSRSRSAIKQGGDVFARRQRKLNLRDWSQVLGSAALVGFPPDVITRATQRCASLFGEGMVMRTMHEIPHGEKAEDPIQYVPEPLQSFLSGSDGISSESSSSDEENRPQKSSVQRNNPTSLQIRKPQCFCPVEDCPRRRNKGFADSNALKAHVQRAHQVSKDQLDDYILPSDEEMDGAVHVDGFLKPTKHYRVERGSYKGASKRTREDDTDRSDDESTWDENSGSVNIMPETKLRVTRSETRSKEEFLEDAIDD